MWLGDNPLCLDSIEFRNQHRRILPLEFYIKIIIRIIESEGLAFVCYHMFECLLFHLFMICFNYLLAITCWKIFFYSTLPLLLDMSVSLLAFPFCNDHQIIGVSRCENPWWSLFYKRWWECCGLDETCVGSLLRSRIHVFLFCNFLLYGQSFWNC